MPVGAAAAAVASGGDAAAVKARIRADRLARERAERQRVADLAQPDAGMKHRADLGAPLAIKRGLVSVDKDAHLFEDPAAADSRQYRGARSKRVWAPDTLSGGRSPILSAEAYTAAERFISDWLLGECGARAGGADASNVRMDPWSRLPYSERRAMARQSWRFAMRAAGPRFSPVLVWCVLQETPAPDVPPTTEAWGKSVGWNPHRASTWLAAALEVLATHYGYTKASPATIAPGRAEGDGT